MTTTSKVFACKGQRLLAVAGISGFIVVALGAFAAHGLTKMLPEYLLAVFKTGVQYQAWHTFALLACGILLQITAQQQQMGSKQQQADSQNQQTDPKHQINRYNEKARKGLAYAGGCFIIGILCFSGSLYALALTGIKWFGPITPLGGVFFMLGWIIFTLSVIRLNKVTS
ncbi:MULTISPECIES: DUF423 domain-containing protein [Vibrio]|uniref:DUF423 domain-containing protein n=1 Tax=Vibrio algicola TaxID=2662262 RepID=A0A5Q0TEU9_9VIBR|nr:MULTISPECIES: DUF423 domain-containing protein [Vibrio]MBD1575100.1 DUF423 domain-containing protein [Vibrio sp. S11_S32]